MIEFSPGFLLRISLEALRPLTKGCSMVLPSHNHHSNLILHLEVLHNSPFQKPSCQHQSDISPLGAPTAGCESFTAGVGTDAGLYAHSKGSAPTGTLESLTECTGLSWVFHPDLD
jgi:hypothetical protein